MKATEQYFPVHVVLFIMLYSVVLTFESVNKILKSDHSFQMKATEQYFPVVLFMMQCRVVLTSESVDGSIDCDHSNQRTTHQQQLLLEQCNNVTLQHCCP